MVSELINDIGIYIIPVHFRVSYQTEADHLFTYQGQEMVSISSLGMTVDPDILESSEFFGQLDQDTIQEIQKKHQLFHELLFKHFKSHITEDLKKAEILEDELDNMSTLLDPIVNLGEFRWFIHHIHKKLHNDHLKFFLKNM